MKNMGSILMDIDAFDVFAINIAPEMITLVNNQTTFTMTVSHTGKCSTIDTGSNDQIIILFTHISLIFLQK
jgi:hypothetical protein